MKNNNGTLRETVETALTDYIKDLDGDDPCNLYDKIIAEIEKPLFSTVMDHCANNQSKAASLHTFFAGQPMLMSIIWAP